MLFMKILYLVVFILIVEVKSQAGGIDIEYRSAFDQELYETVIDEEKCNEQLEYLANNPAVALQFPDASGKIPTGLFSGNLADLGDYHLCLGIRHVDKNMEIEGKFCMMQYSLKQDSENDNNVLPPLMDKILGDIKQYRLTQRYAQMISGAGHPIVPRVIPVTFAAVMNMSIGTCVPKVCRPWQAIQFLQRRFLGNTSLGDTNTTYDEMFCRLPNDRPFSVADYMAIFLPPEHRLAALSAKDPGEEEVIALVRLRFYCAKDQPGCPVWDCSSIPATVSCGHDLNSNY